MCGLGLFDFGCLTTFSDVVLPISCVFGCFRVFSCVFVRVRAVSAVSKCFRVFLVFVRILYFFVFSLVFG